MKTSPAKLSPIEKLVTDIAGFDHISCGGLPKHRTTLVLGTSGSAKTVFAAQFLAEGISKLGETGVFVTFEEAPGNIRKNMASMGWTLRRGRGKGSGSLWTPLFHLAKRR